MTLVSALALILKLLEDIKQNTQTIILNQQNEMLRCSAAGLSIGPLPEGITLSLEHINQLLLLETCCDDSDVRGNLVSSIYVVCSLLYAN